MARDGIPSAVLLDALGTLVELETPWPYLAHELADRGVVVDLEAARAAMLAEMGYYRAHHDEARDWAALKDLRRRCAAVVQESLGTSRAAGRVEDALLAAIRFRAYPEVPPRCAPAGRRRAPGRGLQLGRLAARRARAHRPARRWSTRSHLGRARRRQARPGDLPRRARPAGGRAADAMHVGDSVEADVAGARAAGIEPVLVARNGGAGARGVRAWPRSTSWL